MVVAPDVHRQRPARLVRRRAGRLPVRDDLRGVRRGLPLRGVAAPTPHRDAQPSGLGCVPAAHGAQRWPRYPALVGTQLLAQGFIRRRSRTRWLAHQLVFWGCILAAARHLPPHAGPPALRERRSAGRPLPGVRVAGRDDGVRRGQRRGLAHLPRPRHRRGAGARRGVHLPAAPAARPRRAGGRAQRRLPGARRALRRVGHRAVPHRVEHSGSTASTTRRSTPSTPSP